VKGANVSSDENRNKEFAKLYREQIDNVAGIADRNQVHMEYALCHLINRFAEEIPPVECDRFHKTFRQNDVLDFDAPEDCGGAMDMVFWNLLNGQCEIFWRLQGEWSEKLKAEEAKQEVTDGGS
jgi:hypothetical protein